MHSIYAAYLFLSTAYLPYRLLMFSFGYSMPCGLWQRMPYNTTLIMLRPRLNAMLSNEMALMAVTAMLFAVGYMLTARDENDAESICDTDATNLRMELVRVVFWTYVWYQSFAFLGGLLLIVPGLTYTDLAFLNALHVLPLSELCQRPNNSGSGSNSSLAYVLSAVTWMGWYVGVAMRWPKMGFDDARFLYLFGLLLCDGLLLLGHTYDRVPTIQLILNCRLFYVAATLCLIEAWLLPALLL